MAKQIHITPEANSLLAQAWEFAMSHTTYEYQIYLYSDRDGIAHYETPKSRLEQILWQKPPFRLQLPLRGQFVQGELSKIDGMHDVVTIQVAEPDSPHGYVEVTGAMVLFHSTNRRQEQQLQSYLKRETRAARKAEEQVQKEERKEGVTDKHVCSY